MKIYSTVDESFDNVCKYLAQPEHYRDYNTLLVNVQDVTDITPHSKLCWGQTPKLREYSLICVCVCVFFYSGTAMANFNFNGYQISTVVFMVIPVPSLYPLSL